TSTTPATPPPSLPATADVPPADARGNVTKTSGAARGRGGRAFMAQAGANLVNTLRGLPAQPYHIAFAAGNLQAREFAVQLQTALNAAGWTSSGMQPTQENTPAPLAIGVPRRTPSTNALFNWATRSGFNPDYRVMPQLKEVHLIVGPP